MKRHEWPTYAHGPGTGTPMAERNPATGQWGWRCLRCGMFVPNLKDGPESSILAFNCLEKASVCSKFLRDCDEYLVRSTLAG